jgi:mannose-6-phosphate isomerase-like protein (cupin superfamily)
MKHIVLASQEGQNYDWASDHIYVKTPKSMTDGRVTLVEDTLKAGFHLPRHHHKQMIEIFYILAGEVIFKFDDETVVATAGMTVNVPPHIWHDVSSPNGGKLLTIFSPGGFDEYLSTLAGMSKEEFDDADAMTRLAEKYDTWTE